MTELTEEQKLAEAIEKAKIEILGQCLEHKGHFDINSFFKGVWFGFAAGFLFAAFLSVAWHK